MLWGVRMFESGAQLHNNSCDNHEIIGSQLYGAAGMQTS